MKLPPLNSVGSVLRRINPFSFFAYPLFLGFGYFFLDSFYSFGWHPGAKKELEELKKKLKEKSSH